MIITWRKIIIIIAPSGTIKDDTFRRLRRHKLYQTRVQVMFQWQRVASPGKHLSTGNKGCVCTGCLSSHLLKMMGRATGPVCVKKRGAFFKGAGRKITKNDNAIVMTIYIYCWRKSGEVNGGNFKWLYWWFGCNFS